MVGRFIVLEGIDGAGTTTQMDRVAAAFRVRGQAPVLTTREPSTGPVGVLLRQFLTGRLVMPGGGKPSAEVMALLFAADRLDHVAAEIEPALSSGANILCDRYDASSLAYQSVTSGADSAESLAWLRTLNCYARRPDLTVVLDTSPLEAAARRKKRGGPEEMYDALEVQERLALFYRDLPVHMPTDKIAVVSGDGAIGEVTERILRVLDAHE